VEQHVAVAHQLAGRSAVEGEAEPVNNVVEPSLHDAQEHLAGVLRRARGQGKITAELSLQDAVETFWFLFFAQAKAGIARVSAPGAVHSGGGVAAFDGALGAVAARALEEELNALAAAQFAFRVELSGHFVTFSGRGFLQRTGEDGLYAAFLGSATAVVRE